MKKTFVLSQDRFSLVDFNFPEYPRALDSRFREYLQADLAILVNSIVSLFKIGLYCGSTLPLPLSSSGNTMFIDFGSDSTTEQTGFRLKYSFSVKSK